MYAGPWPYPFGETQSGVTLHFFGVYLRSLNRLLLFVYGFFALGWIVSRLKKESFAPVLRQKPFLFFLGWLLVTIVPYSHPRKKRNGFRSEEATSELQSRL